MPEASEELLRKAREARATAVRSRRLADQQPDDETRIRLTRYADEMEADAVKLEQRAFNVPPAEVTQVRQQQEKMQQAEAEKDDESS